MPAKNVLTRSKKQKALALYHAGELIPSREILEKVVKTDPRDAEAWCVLAAIHGAQGRFEDALFCGEHAVRAQPNFAEAWNNLSAAYEALGRFPEAEDAARRALSQSPDFVDAYFNLGNALRGQKRFEDALEPYERATQQRPTDAEIWVNLGMCHMQQKSFLQAEECFREALKHRSNYVEAYNNLGSVLRRQGKSKEAESVLRTAIRVQPNYVNAHINLGLLLNQEGQLEEAAHHFEECLRINPDIPSVWHNLGGTRLNQGRVEEALTLYHKSLRPAPDEKVDTGLFHSNYLFALNYNPKIDAASIYSEHLAWGNEYRDTPSAHDIHLPQAPVEGRLKIGYVSPDFRRHSVAFFIEPVLAHHNRQDVEVFCYANVARPDRTTKRLQEISHHWRDIRDIPDDEIVKKIRADGIHILVDLAGHTGENRLPVFTHHPAPVQVSYLGYANTTGIRQIDYRLTDVVADPPGQEAFHTEQLVRLPRGFLCYQPSEETPTVGNPPATDLDHVSFGSFNVMPKINEGVIELWAKILSSIPRARLIVKNLAMRDEATRDRFSSHIENQGIPSDRVELIGWLQSPEDHLALYNRIDIALDTFPYNGTTTTCEALWMGVPVVTLAGDRHAGRVGVSLLTQVGLPELIAESPDDYVKLAVALAANTEHLKHLRSTMRERMLNSPLCDAKGFTRSLEDAYREMWRVWCVAN